MNKNEIGDRLRAERNRLGLSQESFAEIGGVKKLAQISYEQGKTLPDAGYLYAVADLGVDVQFVVTGEHSELTISAQENKILNVFRNLDELEQIHAFGFLEGLGALKQRKVTGPASDFIYGEKNSNTSVGAIHEITSKYETKSKVKE
jgi:transcriptional regulator with XRE-family HTH domain